MTVNHSTMKLGKKQPVFDHRIPSIQKLLATGVLPPVPDNELRWEQVKAWLLGENDQIGDCTAVGAANHILNQSTIAGSPITLTDKQIVSFYSQCSGFDPNAAEPDGENPTDVGAVETDVLSRWATTGIADAQGADKLAGFATLDPGNIVACKQSIHLFGGIYVGLALPIAAQTMEVWDAPPHGQPLHGDLEPGSWGGHCITIPGYAKDGTFTGITWGQPKVITRAFWRAYGDEAYVLLNKDWMKASGQDADGIAWAQLATDMHSIRAECAQRVADEAKAQAAAASEASASNGDA